MPALTIEFPDQLYDRVRQRAAEHACSPQEEIVEIVRRASDTENGSSLDSARSRMRELLDATHGFRMTPRIPREELHERGRLS
jgi:plasmid stability protein